MASEIPLTLTEKLRDRERWMRFADCVAVGLAVSLPWSTSATGILAALLAIVVLPTTRRDEWRGVLRLPAGWLPVLFVALGALGMLWANVPMVERLDGLKSFLKLLFIPLLMIQFQRSERGAWVMAGFLISCTVLVAVSWFLALTPGLEWRGDKAPGIPSKDFISQSAMLTLAIFVMAAFALEAWTSEKKTWAIFLVAVSLAFLVNLVSVTFTRATVIVLPVLIILFGFTRLSWRATLAMVGVAAAIFAVAWPLSSQLRSRVTPFATELHRYSTENAPSSAAERLEFYRKSLGFIARAPIIGHGTGAIRSLFRESAVGQTGVSALAAANPHNQTLAVAIQLGLVGAAVLIAMWIAHLALFRGGGIAAWVGLVVVVQNVVNSLFNSHLFDFTHGWLYVVGVGIAAGTVLHQLPVVKGGAAT